MEEGLLSLRWNDHGQTFFHMLSSIRKNESFCDVTLACDGYFYPVHKFVLSTCSDFFYQMFEKTSCKHPVIVIANVGHKDLEALLNYMYLGEVNVLQTELTGLVKAAEILRIKGLAEHSKNSPSKETREKRTSLWETDQSESKRRKNDDHSSVHKRQKESERVQHTKESTLRSRICDSDKHNHTNAESSETALDDTLDSVELSSGEMTNIKSDSVSAPKEHHLQDAVRPEVKIEEICVKEEPSGSWYHDDEKELDSYQYGDSEGGLGYDSHPTTFQENCSPWELAATQVQAMENQMSGIPGPSGMQGVPDRRSECSNEEQRERYRKYDATRRSRNFVEHWRLEFSWVYYDAEMRVMTCTTCLKYGSEDDKKTRFVSGNSNFKRLALVRHEQSQTHRRCDARRRADIGRANSASPETG